MIESLLSDLVCFEVIPIFPARFWSQLQEKRLVQKKKKLKKDLLRFVYLSLFFVVCLWMLFGETCTFFLDISLFLLLCSVFGFWTEYVANLWSLIDEVGSRLGIGENQAL